MFHLGGSSSSHVSRGHYSPGQFCDQLSKQSQGVTSFTLQYGLTFDTLENYEDFPGNTKVKKYILRNSK